MCFPCRSEQDIFPLGVSHHRFSELCIFILTFGVRIHFFLHHLLNQYIKSPQVFNGQPLTSTLPSVWYIELCIRRECNRKRIIYQWVYYTLLIPLPILRIQSSIHEHIRIHTEFYIHEHILGTVFMLEMTKGT